MHNITQKSAYNPYRGGVAMRRKWICAVQLVLSLMMVIGLAIGCAVPSPTATPRSTPVVEEIKEVDPYEQYFVEREITGYGKNYEPTYKYTYMRLRTGAQWEKGTSKEPIPGFGMIGQQPTGFYWLLGFRIQGAPWVVNWSYEPREFTALDPLGSKAKFDVSIFSKTDFDKYFYSSGDQFMLSFHLVGEYRGVSDKAVHSVVGQESGDYVIALWTENVEDIVDWWVKLGFDEATQLR